MGHVERAVFLAFLTSALFDALLTAQGVMERGPWIEENPVIEAVLVNYGLLGAGFVALQYVLLTGLLRRSRTRGTAGTGTRYALAGTIGHVQGALTWLR